MCIGGKPPSGNGGNLVSGILKGAPATAAPPSIVDTTDAQREEERIRRLASSSFFGPSGRAGDRSAPKLAVAALKGAAA